VPSFFRTNTTGEQYSLSDRSIAPDASMSLTHSNRARFLSCDEWYGRMWNGSSLTSLIVWRLQLLPGNVLCLEDATGDEVR
jgi:hypothetical protein